MSSRQDQDDPIYSTYIRPLALAGAAIAGVAAIGVFAWALYVVVFRFPGWQRILENHFSAIIGLPSAAAVAFAIVVFLRQTEGPMEFEGLGFKIKGAAGQVFMWICCFLAIAGAIKLLW